MLNNCYIKQKCNHESAVQFFVAGRPQCPLRLPIPTPASCRTDGYCGTALWTLSVRDQHKIKACVRCTVTRHIEQDQSWLVVLHETVWLWKARNRKTETDAPTLASCLVRKSMKPKPRWAPPIPFFGRRTVFSSPNVLTKRNKTCTSNKNSHEDYFTIITRVPISKPWYFHSNFCYWKILSQQLE